MWPWGPISARDPVKYLCKLDLPEFGGPIMASWAAPSGRTVCAGPDRAAAVPSDRFEGTVAWRHRLRAEKRFDLRALRATFERRCHNS